jgi:hypothetical protein
MMQRCLSEGSPHCDRRVTRVCVLSCSTTRSVRRLAFAAPLASPLPRRCRVISGELALRTRRGTTRCRAVAAPGGHDAGGNRLGDNSALAFLLRFFPLISWPDVTFATRRTLLEIVRATAVLLACILLASLALLALDSVLLRLLTRR